MSDQGYVTLYENAILNVRNQAFVVAEYKISL